MLRKMHGDGQSMPDQIQMRGISFGSIRTISEDGADGRYPLTFVMAQKVININVDREIALQSMQRLHSCYHNVIEILKMNKVQPLVTKLTVGTDSSRVIFTREHRI